MARRLGGAIGVMAIVLVGFGWTVGAPGALAACHAFAVSVNPAQSAEGTTVTVTVSRDGAVNPSQIDVATVDGTAKGGEDYTPLKKTVSFTTDLSQTFPVPLTDDSAVEGSETFKVHLSNPGGCQINTNYSVGPDANVTILDNDTAAPTTASTAAPTTAAPTTARPATTVRTATTAQAAATTVASTTTPAPTSSTASTEPTSSSTTGGTELATQPAAKKGGGSAGAVIAALAALLVVGGAGAGLFFRSRRVRGPAA